MGQIMAANLPITEHIARTDRHTTFYLACGHVEAPVLIFVHGWPELSVSWRNQLPCFASLGFRCIAPDMRGYGRSTVYSRHEDYALEHSVRDLIELLDTLGHKKAVWIGHDWGSPVVWSIASHHPERCFGVASLCIPYFSRGFAPATLIPLVDRTVHPAAQFPAGQWEYQLFYEENFSKVRAAFDANVRNTVKALFRRGNPELKGKPTRTALVRQDGGWFGGADAAPDLLLDTDVLTDEDLSKYVAALERNGFFGPGSWYMNHDRNLTFATRAMNAGKLTMPVLFFHAAYDFACDTLTSQLAEPMRQDCANLTEAIILSGHWMAQEKPIAVNAALARWLATRLPKLWDGEPMLGYRLAP